MNPPIVIRPLCPGKHSWVATEFRVRPAIGGVWRNDNRSTWTSSRDEAIYIATYDIPEPCHK